MFRTEEMLEKFDLGAGILFRIQNRQFVYLPL